MGPRVVFLLLSCVLQSVYCQNDYREEVQTILDRLNSNSFDDGRMYRGAELIYSEFKASESWF